MKLGKTPFDNIKNTLTDWCLFWNTIHSLALCLVLLLNNFLSKTLLQKISESLFLINPKNIVPTFCTKFFSVFVGTIQRSFKLFGFWIFSVFQSLFLTLAKLKKIGKNPFTIHNSSNCFYFEIETKISYFSIFHEKCISRMEKIEYSCQNLLNLMRKLGLINFLFNLPGEKIIKELSHCPSKLPKLR